jgi:hypothetical protein
MRHSGEEGIPVKWWEVFKDLDARIIYLVLLVFIVVPLLVPLNIAMPLVQGSRALYSAVDKLAPGSVVLFPLDWDVIQSIELYPQVRQVSAHIMEKPGVKLVFMSFHDTGPMFAERFIQTDLPKDKKYGVDIVNLGFVPGQATGIARFAQNIAATTPRDFRGTSIGSLPIMNGLKTIKDFTFVIATDSDTPGAADWLRQVQAPYGVKVAALGSQVGVATLSPYVASGQLFAMMGGIRGAAEYEKIRNKPGVAMASMDAQSLAHIWLILLIIVGNLAYHSESKYKSRAR